MAFDKLDSDLLQYIVENNIQPGNRLDALDTLSDKMGISTGKLREQLEVARSLGFVEVKPKTGIKLSDYAFYPAVRVSLLYAVAQDPALFESFSELRERVEADFFSQAVAELTVSDHKQLQELIERAWTKLRGQAIHIPHKEHRELHMTIFSRLGNPFVQGLLAAYWDAYEAVGYTMLSEYNYLQRVWGYHEAMVNAIVAGDIDEAFRLQVQHTKLRPHKEKNGANATNKKIVQP